MKLAVHLGLSLLAAMLSVQKVEAAPAQTKQQPTTKPMTPTDDLKKGIEILKTMEADLNKKIAEKPPTMQDAYELQGALSTLSECSLLVHVYFTPQVDPELATRFNVMMLAIESQYADKGKAVVPLVINQLINARRNYLEDQMVLPGEDQKDRVELLNFEHSRDADAAASLLYGMGSAAIDDLKATLTQAQLKGERQLTLLFTKLIADIQSPAYKKYLELRRKIMNPPKPHDPSAPQILQAEMTGAKSPALYAISKELMGPAPTLE